MLASTGVVLIISALIPRKGCSLAGDRIRAISVGQEIKKDVSANVKREGLAN